ncbi:hypothetical protein, partial [Candidatus Ichthyocystis sparus]|uniref:hypothetical protein n=1 Tax=Candidatus Ichthyocystis sparus TaxID=1561004 RepID=UPI00159EC91A
MNPVTGVSSAGLSDDDQADSGGLQQVQILPGSGLDVSTTVAAVSTIAATSSVVTTSTVLTTFATTSTNATTSVGKGSSGSRSDKVKGPAPKLCAAGSVVSAYPDPADASPELSDPTSSVTTAARTCTANSDFDIVLGSVVASARSYHAVADAHASSAAAAAAAAARAHANADAPIPDTNPDPASVRARALACARAMDKYACDVAARAAAARATAAAADHVVALARAVAADLVVAQDQSADSRVHITCPDFGIIIDSVIASALAYNAAARAADARADSAAAAAARATDALANLDAAACAGAPISDTDNAARARRARSRDSFCARAADSQDRAAAARAAAVAADRVVALARAFAADHIVDQDRAADSRVPSPGPDSGTTSNSGARTAAVSIAGLSTSSLLPDSSLMPPGFVDLFGFVVSLGFSEVVNKLISEVCALAKNIIFHCITRTVSDILRNLSNSERRAWCLTNGKLYELKFVARCFAEYSSKLLPTFINNLCGVRTWDFSSRSLVLLMGNRLADFWASLDKAIFKAIT